MEIREGGEAVGARGARGAMGSKGKRMRGVGECWKKGRRTEGSKSRCSHSALPDVEESPSRLYLLRADGACSCSCRKGHSAGGAAAGTA